MTAALVGNPNCGKTTLFNKLTGSDVRVGNFPGVTVSVNAGTINGLEGWELADLPGIYSLSGISDDERCAASFLEASAPELLINVIDGTTISRGLWLTLRLTSLDIPMIGIVTMMDEVERNGVQIDAAALSRELGFPVMEVSSSDEDLEQRVLSAIKRGGRIPCGRCGRSFRKRWYYADRGLGDCLSEIEDFFSNSDESSLSAAFRSETAFLREREKLPSRLATIAASIERERGMSADEALASAGYKRSDEICAACVSKISTKQNSVGLADKILTGKFSRIFFAAGILSAVWFIFGVFAREVTALLDGGLFYVSSVCSNLLNDIHASPVVSAIVCGGIIGGVGSVLSFLPVILAFFLFLSVLEDSGYASRAAYIFDSPMRRIGLSGRCIVPLITGGGCSVPAIMSTRTLTSGKERALCIFLIPYVSCSAKIPVYTTLAAAFFGRRSGAAVVFLWFFSLLVGIAASSVIGKIIGGGKDIFVLEMPPYRMPSLGSVVAVMRRRTREFISKAFGVIFVSSVAISLLRSLTPAFTIADSPADSMLMKIGGFISPIFAPLGFGTAAFAAAAVCGITAKEAVVSTLAVVLSSPGSAFTSSLTSAVSPAGGVAFLVFVALGVPCVASLSAVKRELNFGRAALLVLAWGTVSYVLSFVAYLAVRAITTAGL